MQLTDKHLEVITKTAIAVWEEKKKDQEKKKYDRRLRNIKLLLRNYRSFVKHCGIIKVEIVEINEEIESALLDSDELKLESIKKSKEKTLAMVKFINKMLAVYKATCEQGKPEDLRRYEVIHYMYISEEKKTAEEISALQSVAVRTIFLDIEKACKDLSVLVFGIDGVHFVK